MRRARPCRPDTCLATASHRGKRQGMGGNGEEREEMPVRMIRYKCEGVRDINQMQFDRAREMREGEIKNKRGRGVVVDLAMAGGDTRALPSG